jgi:trehalose 6-phosphate phosphatase
MMPAPPDNLDLSRLALFLDVDGTLLDIEDHPAGVTADPSLVALLTRLSEGLGGALSLISGRPVADLDRIFGGARFAAAGGHGAELRLHPDDAVSSTKWSLPASILEQIRAFAGTDPGLLLEEKRGGVSLHYRRAPQLEEQCTNFVRGLVPELQQDFRLIAGKMVFEFAPREHHKGAAIDEMMQQDPFAGRRAVFIGDDVTDEDGFRAVKALDGITIRVGGSRDSEAEYSLTDVAAVRFWLESIEQRVSR